MTYDNLTGAILLKADHLTQNVSFDNIDLISENEFWGVNLHNGLYYDYTQSTNNDGYAVLKDGWGDYSDHPAEKMNGSQTAAWVNSKILSGTDNNICVIQGYAGCGKTVFINSILQQAKTSAVYCSYHDFYIGHNTRCPEEIFITSTLHNTLAQKICESLLKDRGMEIYERFVGFFDQKLSILSPILPIKVASCFTSKDIGSLYDAAKNLYINRNSGKAPKYKDEYYEQFVMSYNCFNLQLQNESERQKCMQISTVDILVFIDILWRCALSSVQQNEEPIKNIIVYDNLDIIDNHEVVANFIDTLRSVLSNYNKYRHIQNQISLPSFKIVVIVRKITYAGISKFNEVGHVEIGQNQIGVDFIEISNLYSNSEVLKHKARYFLDHMVKFDSATHQTKEKIHSFMQKIIDIPDIVFNDIKFSELFNHNLRACSNMLQRVLDHSLYKDYLVNESLEEMSEKCKAGIWINIICTSLQELAVWNSMEYNSSSNDTITNPTTLSRLILTLLSNYRKGYSRGEIDFTSPDVTFEKIIRTFEWIPFSSCNKNRSWEKEKALLAQKYNINETHNRICLIMAKMLQRNNVCENIELWRRPIYYTHHAFPLNNTSEIHKALAKQISDFDMADSRITSFCITDEGSTFVEKIATHFEFYSVRYNNNNSIPLCCITDSVKLSNLIQTVFEEVKKCLDKQLWIMGYYTQNDDTKTNEYLGELFHPRTDSFSPQLHIVRTIFDHIDYMSRYRNYISTKHDRNSEPFGSINRCLVKWIGKYLNLYRINLYDKLNDTIANHNNSIWLDLKYLYAIVISDEKLCGVCQSEDFIRINRKDTITRQNRSMYDEQNNFSDTTLLDNPMLLD